LIALSDGLIRKKKKIVGSKRKREIDDGKNGVKKKRFIISKFVIIRYV